ncbi:serine/threonine-protein kinase [Actinomadura rugatobispora]|uniref:non-specific serine/threonine protein kinase n=1 Tax=Actinomadura rugatobispora TaxID=1994 RepID=A0ABW0ZL59_9ACTN
MPDRVLAGRYRLRERLGSGGMGTVWSAVDETLRRDVAVKEIVFPDGLTSEERRVATGRAQREARAAALVDHPGVITVHDVVVEDDRPWIVMELLSGPSLEQTVRRDGPRPPAAVAHIGLQLLDALCAAHAKGIVHRDVKPANVLFARDGHVVLTDFGIASIEADPALTRTGAFVGSPGYAAPERLREQPAGPESDFWSLGATLYMAVEGRSPFERDSPMAVLGAVLREQPAPPRQAGSLSPLLWHLLQKDPSARPGVDVIRQVLHNVAAGRPSGLPDPMPPPPPRRPGALVPVLAGAAMLTVIVLAVVFVAVFAFSGDDQTTAATPTAAPTSPPATTPSASPTSGLDPCSLLTAEQVRRLLADRKSQQEKDSDKSCGWAAKKRGVSLTNLTLGTGGPPPETSVEAHNKFVSWRNARSKASDSVYWGWPEIDVKHVRGSQSAARTVSGIGDEAFAYTTTGLTQPMDKAFVVVRVKHVVIEVEHIYERGTATTDDAAQAARWVAQSLASKT